MGSNVAVTEVTTRLDVRDLPTWERYPRVFAAFDALPIGGELAVVSDDEPRALRYEFDQQRTSAFVWDQQMLDEEIWLATIRRVPADAVLTDLPSFFRHCSTLADLDDSMLARMAQASEERTLEPGAVLAEQGDNLGVLVLVRSGVVAVIATSPDGREQLLYEALPFEALTAIEIFDGGACLGRLVAAYGAARVVLVRREVVIELAQRSPMFAQRLGMRAALRSRALAERVRQLAFSSTTARIARTLLPYAGPAAGMVPTLPPLSHMSQGQIATIAGTVRIVAARALSKLAKENAIELHRGKVVRIDRERLRVL